MRRLISLAASTGLAVVFAVAPAATTATAAPTGTSAGSCSLSAPARVGIGAPYTKVTLRLSSDCAQSGTVYASWDLYHTRTGWDGMAIFDGTSTDYWDIYDWDYLGRYEWRPSMAHDSNYDDVWQNSPTTDVRVSSWASLTGTRSGSTARLTTSVARYSGSYDRLIPWTNKLGAIQIQKSGSTAWTHIGYVKSNVYGKASFSATIATTTKVRVVFPDENVIWGVWTPGRTI